MVTSVKQTKFLKRSRRIGLIATATAVALLTLLWIRANAFHFIGGAYGCGNIDEALANTEEGRTFVPMIPERDSFGAVITRNIVIQGGWDFPDGGSNCAGLREMGTEIAVLEGKEGLRSQGFVFQAPMTRSALTVGPVAPILTISPTVTQLVIEHMQFDNAGANPTSGGGISGTLLNDSDIRLTNLLVTETSATDSGGGLYFEVRNGSKLLIEDSELIGNSADDGGGIEIHVYDNSEVTIQNTYFENNQATNGDGGAIRLIMHGGSVNILNSTFINNSATGSGGAIQVMGMGGSSEVCIINSVFSGNNAASDNDVSQSGSGVTVCNLGESINLPVVMVGAPATFKGAQITNITLNDNYQYVVEFDTFNFTPTSVADEHLHFFFNTVPPEEAGSGGAGPWEVYGSTDPFTLYTDTDKPPFATQMCVLFANPDHTVEQNTGNCFDLPVNK